MKRGRSIPAGRTYMKRKRRDPNLFFRSPHHSVVQALVVGGDVCSCIESNCQRVEEELAGLCDEARLNLQGAGGRSGGAIAAVGAVVFPLVRTARVYTGSARTSWANEHW